MRSRFGQRLGKDHSWGGNDPARNIPDLLGDAWHERCFRQRHSEEYRDAEYRSISPGYPFGAEQILYEIADPAAYLVPDVTLDITDVEVDEVGPNRVRVRGARGKARPPTLKVTISTEGGWLAEGEISYGGPNALARAELAARVLEERLALVGLTVPTRIDVIGTVSTFDSARGDLREAGSFPPDGDYRVRLAASAADRATAGDARLDAARL